MINKIIRFAAMKQAAWKQMEREEYGYERKTTFYSDLTIADIFGADAVQDTYDRVVKEWMDNIEYITEFCMCVNHKSWEHVEDDVELCKLYSNLYYDLKSKVYEHYEGNKKATQYFFQTID
jgi:hypothetical protein